MKTLVVTASIKISEDDTSYLKRSLKLIDTYITYTDFDILILTNDAEFYKGVNKERVSIVDYDKYYGEPIKSAGRFNMHIKRLPIRLGSETEYDIIYHHDCDCYIDGWGDESYKELISEDHDVIFPTSERPQLGGLRREYKHFQNKIDKEFSGLYYDDLDNSPNPAETRIIFKNNKKLKDFLDFWDKISNQNKNFFTYHCGVYFGTSAKHAKMKMYSVKPHHEFSKYGKITHGGEVLNYFGIRI